MARVARSDHQSNHRNRSRYSAQRTIVSPRRKHHATKRGPTVSFTTPPSASRTGQNHTSGANDHSANYSFHDTIFGDNDDDEEGVHHGSDAEDQLESDSECSVFQWEEESTLFDDLMGRRSNLSGDDSIGDLIDSLQDAFTGQGKLNKQEMAQVLVPCHNEIKANTKFYRDTIDRQYSKPLMLFNLACKDSELAILKRREALRVAREEGERLYDQIMERLKHLFEQRAAVWTTLREQMEKLLEPTHNSQQNLPARVELSITEAEKEARKYEKAAFQKIRWDDLLRS